MSAFRDLSKQHFGRWFVQSRSDRAGCRISWNCICACGNTGIVQGANLVGGSSLSCGCLQKEEARARFTTHGGANGGHPLYALWQGMHARCYNPKHISYRRYGGRGIKVCERWHDFANFVADVGERPPGTSLDRNPDPAGDYGPHNFRWATQKQQMETRELPAHMRPKIKEKTSCA